MEQLRVTLQIQPSLQVLEQFIEDENYRKMYTELMQGAQVFGGVGAGAPVLNM